MDPVILSSLIGAGASAIGQGIGLGVNANLNKKNREWNEQQAIINRQFQSDEAQKARDWNFNSTLQLMDKENEYNAASAQFDRLLQTGMNPATALGMISGNGNAMASGSVQGATPASGSMPSGSDVYGAGLMSSMFASGLSDIGSIFADLPLKQAELNLKLEDRISKQIDNKMRQFESEHQEEMYMKEFELMDATLEEMKAKIENEELDAELKKWDLKKQDYELSILVNELAMSNMDVAAKQKFIDYDLRIRAAEAQLAEVRSKNEETVIKTQIETMKAQMASLYANAALAGAQKEGVDLENQLRDFNVRHQDDRYGREVAEYEQRMKNYKTERTMSIVNGAVNGLGQVASIAYSFLNPVSGITKGALSSAISSLGSVGSGESHSVKSYGASDIAGSPIWTSTY